MTIAYRSSCSPLRAIAFERCLYYKYSSNEYLLFSEKDQMNPYTSPAFKELNHLILRLGFIKTYNTYLKALQKPPPAPRGIRLLTPRSHLDVSQSS